jgi:hypothetical protein
MKKRWLGTIAALALAALAVAAGPAFTEDTGSIAVTVTAAPVASPCIEFLTPTQVRFGTLPFSRATQPSSGLGDIAPTFRNCSTATQSFTIAAEDATSGQATWTFAGGSAQTCPTPDIYRILYTTNNGLYLGISKPPEDLRNTVTTSTEFAAGEQHDLGFQLLMPCQGSTGSGQTFSMDINLVARLS